MPVLQDELLFTSTLMAVPILLALATEIALKTWQCHERGEAPDRKHDLIELLDGLSEEAHTQLERRFPAQLDPFGAQQVSPVGAGMRKTLEFHAAGCRGKAISRS